MHCELSVRPFLTVFVPTAPHRGSVLLNCLFRLSFQEELDFEVIVISNGKMPELDRPIPSFSDLRFYASEECIGEWGHPQTALAIREARGEWFVRVNDDNVVYPCFSKEIQIAGKKAACDILIWEVYVANQSEHHGLVLPTVLPPKPNAIDMLNFAVRTELAQEIGFPFSSFAADWEFLNACLTARQGRYHYIPEILAEHW